MKILCFTITLSLLDRTVVQSRRRHAPAQTRELEHENVTYMYTSNRRYNCNITIDIIRIVEIIKS